jgi:hypothetical protein
VAVVLFVATSPVWLLLGYYLLSATFNRHFVTIVNKSGEAITGGELEAFHRVYPIGPIPKDGSRDVSFRVPGGENPYWILLRTKSGRRVRPGGDSFGLWFQHETIGILPNGSYLDDAFDNPRFFVRDDRSMLSPDGRFELLLWGEPGRMGGASLVRTDRAHIYEFFSGEAVRGLSGRWLGPHAVLISASAGRRFVTGDMWETDRPQVEVRYALPAGRVEPTGDATGRLQMPAGR